MTYLRPEHDLLIECVKSQLNPGDNTEEMIREILSNVIDWEYFKSITSTNRLIPMVWHTLANENYQKYIPEQVAFDLQKICNEKESRSLYNLNMLNKLLFLCKENKIEIIPFKGPNLNRLYKTYTLRQSSDLDIIIRKKDVTTAINLLMSHGYKPANQLTYDDLKNFLKKKHSFPVVDSEAISEIDVHWCIENSYEVMGTHFPMEKLWDQYSLQRVGNYEIPILNAEALILLTCTHHGRNGWGELRFICDFSLIINSYKDVNWEGIMQAAKKLKIKKVLLVGVSLTNRLLNNPIPNALKKAIEKDKSIEKIEHTIIFERILKKCTLPEIFHSNIWIRYSMKEGFYAKALFLVRFSLAKLKPTSEDQEFIKLPSNLYFIYYLMRPFRLGLKYFLIAGSRFRSIKTTE
jgi:hypothetical protein